MKRLLVSLGLVPVLLGCSMNTPREGGSGGTPPAEAAGGSGAPPAAGAPAGGPIRVELRQREADGTPDAASGGTGAVTVRGTVSTPNPCHTLGGTAAREGRTLTLTVTARSNAEVCVQSIGTLGYEATLSGVPAGAYAVRVLHTYPGSGWEAQAGPTHEVQVR